MKIYNGWILKIADDICTVAGSNKLRGTTYYYLATKNGKRRILRDDLIQGLQSGDIQYIR